jgi:3-deoxy-D-arabino-heptulosonate 7-phosphate (DAHP) synthase class II
MNDKIVDFEQALKRAEQEEKECLCSSCKFKQSTIANFTRLIKGKKIGSDEFNEEVENLIGFVELNARRSMLISLIEALSEQLDYIDGIADDEEE